MTGQIVHEWIERHGGSENVLEQIAREFPEARIQCLWNNSGERFDTERVDETWLARTPLRNSKSLALPFMPFTWRTLRDSNAEWVLCSSHLFAHHARFRGEAKHARKYVYVHSPARYIWAPDMDARGANPLIRAAALPLKALDRFRAREATAIASNSNFVRERVARTWRRDSTVIYPPVDVAQYTDSIHDSDLTEQELELLSSLPDSFILGASRFIPYKRLDLVIRMGQVNKVPVVLAGDGPSLVELQALAAQSPGLVTFVGRPSFPLLRALYERALAYVFPAVEDFGIMPVEAMATGTPVVAPMMGGAAESVLEGRTGTLLEKFDDATMRGAINRVSALHASDCIERAWEFDTSVFRRRIREWVER